MNGTLESQRLESAPSASPLTSTKRENLTQERVRELFDYRDGKLIRKIRTSNRINIGDVAGSKDKNGYIQIRIFGKNYKVHRIIWLWHYGYFPENELDHRNKNPCDNHVENLREIGRVCNSRNTGTKKTNKSGVKGVSWCRQTNRWRAVICIHGRQINLSRQTDFLEVVCHRLAAEQSVDWDGCDLSSPAYMYVKKHIKHIK